MPKYVDAKGIVRDYPGSPFLREDTVEYPITWIEEEEEPTIFLFEQDREPVVKQEEYIAVSPLGERVRVLIGSGR